MKLAYALFTGLVFGTGISISGMIDPAKVLNFLDFAVVVEFFLRRLVVPARESAAAK